MKPGTVSAATWLGYLALCLGMFMAILDIQIVASSLPTLREALHIKPTDLSWIQTAYLIAEIVAIPLTGWLTRLLSLRWLFVAAVTGFTAASIGCAASNHFEMLLVFRVLQGFCGGALIPIVFTSVFVLFPQAAAYHGYHHRWAVCHAGADDSGRCLAATSPNSTRGTGFS